MITFYAIIQNKKMLGFTASKEAAQKKQMEIPNSQIKEFKAKNSKDAIRKSACL